MLFRLAAAGVILGAAGAQDPALTDPVPAAPQGQQSAAPVVVVRLDGELNPSWASILRRAQDTGIERGAVALVLELDTPGGEVELMKQLGRRLDDIGADMQTAVLVTHGAWSAGAFLAMACDRIFMTPGSSMGAATPITIGPGGGIGLPGGLDEAVQEKFQSKFRGEFRSWAESHDREPRIAEAFVDADVEVKRVRVGGQNLLLSGREYDDLVDRGELPQMLEVISPRGELLTLTAQDAEKVGYCDGIVNDLDAVLGVLGLQGRPVVRIEANWSESLVRAIGSWSWLLLLAIAFTMIVAFQMPGTGAPEILAVALLALFLFHGYLVGLAEWTEVLMVAAGVALIFVEIFLTPGTIVAGAVGAVLVLGGLLLAMQDFVVPQGSIDTGTLLDNLLVILVMAVTVPFLAMFATRKFANSRFGSRMVISPSAGISGPANSAGGGASGEIEARVAREGARGTCLTPLRPAGRVEIDGAHFDALSTGAFLDAGSPVAVRGTRGASLLVGPAESAARRAEPDSGERA